jgi:hypothetical protein
VTNAVAGAAAVANTHTPMAALGVTDARSFRDGLAQPMGFRPQLDHLWLRRISVSIEAAHDRCGDQSLHHMRHPGRQRQRYSAARPSARAEPSPGGAKVLGTHFRQEESHGHSTAPQCPLATD